MDVTEEHHNPYENVDFWKASLTTNNPIRDLDHLGDIVTNDALMATIVPEIQAYYKWLYQRLGSALWEEHNAAPYGVTFDGS